MMQTEYEPDVTIVGAQGLCTLVRHDDQQGSKCTCQLIVVIFCLDPIFQTYI